MESIVSTTCDTMLPPFTATSEAASARVLACSVCSAFWRTVELSSSIDEAVSSSDPACCSVRADKSKLPRAISLVAILMASDPVRTCATIPASLSRMMHMAAIRLL